MTQRSEAAGVVLLSFTARREHDLVTAMQGSATVKLPRAETRPARPERDGVT
ncbi:MAG: hypothetical protein OXQ94_06580 [Gemmatimonadota bacterium]|nr:hypothetical protein [Gemmatimonadota bacterium]MDE2871339.1 hypothetical protein [Gemmatimonadota bacterium]